MKEAMKITHILPLMLLAIAVWGQSVPQPRHIETADRLLVREAQLSLAEAHIARLQAVASVRVAEDQITDLLTTLRTRYSCPGCQLNNDLTWIPPKPAEAKGQAPSAAPAPSTASGQTSDKE